MFTLTLALSLFSNDTRRLPSKVNILRSLDRTSSLRLTDSLKNLPLPWIRQSIH